MIRSDYNSVGECCGGKPPLPLPGLERSDSSRPETPLQYTNSSEADLKPQTESSESDDGAMDYEPSRPFKRCTMKSREGLNHHNKSEYKCLKDFPQAGKVVIGKTKGKDAWAKTRRINVTSSSQTAVKQCMSPIFQPWTIWRS